MEFIGQFNNGHLLKKNRAMDLVRRLISKHFSLMKMCWESLLYTAVSVHAAVLVPYALLSIYQ
jgi:hypothetical protein